MATFPCPNCQYLIGMLPSSDIGKWFMCPKCHQKFRFTGTDGDMGSQPRTAIPTTMPQDDGSTQNSSQSSLSEPPVSTKKRNQTLLVIGGVFFFIWLLGTITMFQGKRSGVTWEDTDYEGVIQYAKTLNNHPEDMVCEFNPPSTVSIAVSDFWYELKPFQKERLIRDFDKIFTDQLAKRNLDTNGLKVKVYDKQKQEIAHMDLFGVDIGSN